MTPRVSIEAVPLIATYEEAEHVVNAMYSRFPVFDEDIDDIVGVLSVKALLNVPAEKRGSDFSLRPLLRPAYFIPEGKRVDILFNEMKQQHITMAVVVDEYGGTEGIVTMETVRRNCQDIEDEYDEPTDTVT